MFEKLFGKLMNDFNFAVRNESVNVAEDRVQFAHLVAFVVDRLWMFGSRNEKENMIATSNCTNTHISSAKLILQPFDLKVRGSLPVRLKWDGDEKAELRKIDACGLACELGSKENRQTTR